MTQTPLPAATQGKDATTRPPHEQVPPPPNTAVSSLADATDGARTTATTPAGSPTIDVGSLFGGYRIEAKLGEGGMGAVWKALHVRLDKLVALKVLPQHLTRDPALVARFDREMKSVGKLEHPHIVRAMDAGEVDGTHYLVMEYVAGLDLSKLVRTKGPRPVVEACELVRQAALGLAHAHENGLVHRDIKPSNLLLTQQGKLKILDLGLARLQGASDQDQPTQPEGLTLTGLGMCMGTPDYMAPEQWENTHTVDARADLYALGCTLFFLVTGWAPFDDAAHPSLVQKMHGHGYETAPDLGGGRTDIPADLEALYRALLAKKADDRPENGADVAKALVPIIRGLRSGKASPASGGRPSAESPVAKAASPAKKKATDDDPELEAVLAALIDAPPPARVSSRTSARRRKPSGPAKRPPNGKWIALAAGGLAALLLLGAIVIKITNKDGTKTTIEVPDGATVEVTQDGKPVLKTPNVSTPSRPTGPLPAATADPHRAAAIAVLEAGGGVTLVTGKAFPLVNQLADLPAEPFVVQTVLFDGQPGPFDQACARLKELPSLLHFTVKNSPLTDANLAQLADLDLKICGLVGSGVTDAFAETPPHWRRATIFNLSDSAVGDATCRALAGLPVLTSLDLNHTSITDAGLAELAKCPRLIQLSIARCEAITPQGVAHLKSLRYLRRLDLSGINLGDEVVDVLASMKQLRIIRLTGAQVSADGARRLQEALPSTYVEHPATRSHPEEQALVRWAREQKVREISDCLVGNVIPADSPDPFPIGHLVFDQPSPPGSEAIRLATARGLSYLRWNHLTQADAATEHLGQITGLRFLFLVGSDMTGAGLARLSPLVALETLEVSYVASMDDAALAQLPELPCVTWLTLRDCPIKGAGLQHLTKTPSVQTLLLHHTPIEPDALQRLALVPQLRDLGLAGTAIDDAAVPHLGRCAGLRMLHLERTKLTPEGIARLHAALPECAIRWDGGLIVSERTPAAKVTATSKPADPAADADPHRAAAVAILEAGGSFSGVNAQGNISVTKLADLPAEPFVVRTVTLANLPGPFDAVCARLEKLPGLEAFYAHGSRLTDANLAHLAELDPREVGLSGNDLTDQSADIVSRWTRAVHIDLGYTGVGDATCRELARLPVLHSIHLGGSASITDASLEELAKCPQLHYLVLAHCKAITSRGGASLCRLPRLRVLSLKGTDLGDDVVDVLATAKQCRVIFLDETQVSAAGARRLQQALPDAYVFHPATQAHPEEQARTRWALEQKPTLTRDFNGHPLTTEQPAPLPIGHLDFPAASPPGTDAARLTAARGLYVLVWPNLKDADAAAEHLGQITRLTSLSLEASDITGGGLARLAPLTALAQLRLGRCSQLDDKALAQLPRLPDLYLLYLDGCPITGSGLKHLAQTPNVQLLNLASTQVDSASLEHLAPLTRLRHLFLGGATIDDAAVPPLSQLKGLQHLEVWKTGLTADGIARLRAALPKCAIRWDGGLVVPGVEAPVAGAAAPADAPAATKTGWHGGPANAPKTALTPFDAAQVASTIPLAHQSR